jgi:DNA-binding transcriptional LysR family regulator
MRTVSTEQTLDLVGQGRVDLGIVYGATGSTDTRTDDLGLSEVACVLNKAHALTAKTRIGPSDLVGESVATYRPTRRSAANSRGRFAPPGSSSRSRRSRRP